MRTPDIISKEKQRLAKAIFQVRKKKPEERTPAEVEVMRKMKIRLANLSVRTQAQKNAGWN